MSESLNPNSVQMGMLFATDSAASASPMKSEKWDKHSPPSVVDHRPTQHPNDSILGWLRNGTEWFGGMVFVTPYLILLLLSIGSGWTFPSLFPDWIDLAPWRNFFSSGSDMVRAVVSSAVTSLIVATLATGLGMCVGRFVRRSITFSPWGTVWRFLIYLPFVISPVIAGVCFYDLILRLGLIGTHAGVILVQVIFAKSFASVYFSELWGNRTDDMEQLVANLGGNRWQVWRHGIFPQTWMLIVICFLQTALFSWLDFGLVSVIGGGHVPAVTVQLFAYLREASVNQAAHSSLVLLKPTLAILGVAGFAYLIRTSRPGHRGEIH